MGDDRAEHAPGDAPLQPHQGAEHHGGEHQQRDPGGQDGQPVDRRRDRDGVAAPGGGVQRPPEVQLLGDPVDRGDQRDDPQVAEAGVIQQFLDRVAEERDLRHQGRAGEEDQEEAAAQHEGLDHGKARGAVAGVGAAGVDPPGRERSHGPDRRDAEGGGVEEVVARLDAQRQRERHRPHHERDPRDHPASPNCLIRFGVVPLHGLHEGSPEEGPHLVERVDDVSHRHRHRRRRRRPRRSRTPRSG